MTHYYPEDIEERYCFVQDPVRLANWRWEEVECDEEDDGLADEFLEIFED